MDEKKKLIYILFAVQNTLIHRFNAGPELIEVLTDTLTAVSAQIDPEFTVPPPNGLIFVNDFRLAKDVADRI
jgi:hypothetical protein